MRKVDKRKSNTAKTHTQEKKNIKFPLFIRLAIRFLF